jgi:hypothetical protein
VSNVFLYLGLLGLVCPFDFFRDSPLELSGLSQVEAYWTYTLCATNRVEYTHFHHSLSSHCKAYSPLPLLYFNETFRLSFCFLCIRSFEAPELRSAAWFTWDKGSYSILFCNTKSVHVTSCIVVLRFFEVVRQLVLRYLSARARQKDGRGNHVALYSHANLAVGLRDSTFPTLAGRADQYH